MNKLEGVFCIVAIGGSTTYRTNLRVKYSFILEQKLREKFNDSKIEILNAGLNALDSKGILKRLQEKVLITREGNEVVADTLLETILDNNLIGEYERLNK